MSLGDQCSYLAKILGYHALHEVTRESNLLTDRHPVFFRVEGPVQSNEVGDVVPMTLCMTLPKNLKTTPHDYVVSFACRMGHDLVIQWIAADFGGLTSNLDRQPCKKVGQGSRRCIASL